MDSTDVSTHQQSGSSSDENRGEHSPRFSFTPAFVVKLLFLAGVNGLAIAGLPAMLDQGWWLGVAAVVVTTVLIDYVYLSRRMIPAKYLIPGTIFALIFQVVPVVYSAYIGFTNFGTGNILSKEQAIERAESLFSSAPGSERFQLNILASEGGAGEIALLLTDDSGNRYLGTVDGLEALTPEEVVFDDAGKVQSVGAFVTLNLREVSDRQDEILSLEIPSELGLVRPITATTAAVYNRLYEYDPATDTLTNVETGDVLTPVDGNFTNAAGESPTELPGWSVVVGFDNFTRIITNQAIRGPFVRVFVWNYAFAILSVILTFALGLLLAIALNHPTLRGRRVYRSLLIIPYALPSFMSALIWRGLLNQDFGVINDLLGANIAWLNDPWMAKVSVLLVNLWLGFPYMFLISTGALQAIPDELKEAAYVDGATPRQAFRRVVFPLLLVSLAPLLIASFAFNFNNFNIIYLLNSGGPPIVGAQTPAGHTDILISYTYRLAFEGGRGQDFGLASAIALLIFIMVASISAFSFRRTRALEELT